MCKNKNQNGEIEIFLENIEYHTGEIKWRYTEGRRFLFWKFPGRWYRLWKYDPEGKAPGEFPGDDMYWGTITVDLRNDAEAKAFSKMVSTVRTKKDLYEYFGLYDNYDKYAKDLKEYNENKKI